jgi:hypothetical protein
MSLQRGGVEADECSQSRKLQSNPETLPAAFPPSLTGTHFTKAGLRKLHRPDTGRIHNSLLQSVDSRPFIGPYRVGSVWPVLQPPSASHGRRSGCNHGARVFDRWDWLATIRELENLEIKGLSNSIAFFQRLESVGDVD